MKFEEGFISSKILPKMRNPGMKEFSSISNEILEGIHIKENPSRNEKSRNEGCLLLISSPNFERNRP